MTYHLRAGMKAARSEDLQGWLQFHGAEPRDTYALELDTDARIAHVYRFARNTQGTLYVESIDGERRVATAPTLEVPVLYLPDLSGWRGGPLPSVEPDVKTEHVVVDGSCLGCEDIGFETTAEQIKFHTDLRDLGLDVAVQTPSIRQEQRERARREQAILDQLKGS